MSSFVLNGYLNINLEWRTVGAPKIRPSVSRRRRYSNTAVFGVVTRPPGQSKHFLWHVLDNGVKDHTVATHAGQRCVRPASPHMVMSVVAVEADQHTRVIPGDSMDLLNDLAQCWNPGSFVCVMPWDAPRWQRDCAHEYRCQCPAPSSAISSGPG